MAYRDTRCDPASSGSLSLFPGLVLPRHLVMHTPSKIGVGGERDKWEKRKRGGGGPFIFYLRRICAELHGESLVGAVMKPNRAGIATDK